MNHNKVRPPKIFKYVAEYFVTEYNDYPAMGDLEEEFHYLAETKNLKYAKRWYRKMILKSMPKFVFHSIYWGITMIKNYLKIALRSLIKQKMYSTINIAGLAIGMMVSIFILLFVQVEMNYDQYHENKDYIYRLERRFMSLDGTKSSGFASLAPSFVPLLENEIPEFENISRIFHINNAIVKYEDKKFEEKRFFLAEEDIFEILTIPLIKGSKSTVLKDPFSLVISKSMAEKYFGNDDPLGKRFLINSQIEVKITGIFEDTPELSHLHFDFIGSYLSLKGMGTKDGEDYFLGNNNFSDNVTYVYAKINNKVNVEEIKGKIPALLDKRFGKIKVSDDKFEMASKLTGIKFTPVPDIHLYSNANKEIEANGDITYVTIFTIIAFFVLAIACVNFINLSTARALKRAREVGLRKVIGAHKKMLIIQFLGESVFVTLLASLIAISGMYLLGSYFNDFFNVSFHIDLYNNSSHLLILLAVFGFTSLAAGIYPAFYLSSFNPSAILRGELTKGTKGAGFRKVLVVGQFAISIILIICVIVVNNQIKYISKADLGYNKDNIVLISVDKVIKENWRSIKSNLERNPNVLATALSKRVPSGQLNDDAGFVAEFNGKKFESTFSMPHNRVSHDFFKTYGMEIIAGRDFSIEYPTDSSEAVILNEAAVKKFGAKTPEEAIGISFSIYGQKAKVIGVVKDFNYESLRKHIIPVMTYVSFQNVNTMSIKIKNSDVKSTLDYINSVIKNYHPDYNFSFTFLDQKLNDLYRNENQMLSMFSNFSVLAIFIACLGLFGLASYTAEQKTMEIGIRKVHGASISDIIFRLSKEFVYLVLIASVIAIPIAYYFMIHWLDSFAYKTTLNFYIAIASVMVTLIIALSTVSFQAFRAAKANPVDSLKCE